MLNVATEILSSERSAQPDAVLAWASCLRQWNISINSVIERGKYSPDGEDKSFVKFRQELVLKN